MLWIWISDCDWMQKPDIRRKATGVTFLALPYGNKAAHSGSSHNTMNEFLSLSSLAAQPIGTDCRCLRVTANIEIYIFVIHNRDCLLFMKAVKYPFISICCVYMRELHLRERGPLVEYCRNGKNWETEILKWVVFKLQIWWSARGTLS